MWTCSFILQVLPEGLDQTLFWVRGLQPWVRQGGLLTSEQRQRPLRRWHSSGDLAVEHSSICLLLPDFKRKLVVVRFNLTSCKIHLLMFSWGQSLPTGHSPGELTVELKLPFGSCQSNCFVIIVVLFTFVSSEMPFSWFHYWASMQIVKSVIVFVVILFLQNSFAKIQGQLLN